MTYEDYLIHSSELQHAFWSKKRPKYFKKDKGRYFYSKEEWEAFINKGRKKLDKAVTRFKKDATKQFKSYQKSARKDREARQKRQSMERMERSRTFKQGLVDTKYAIQNFSKNASKKMNELKASASKQISRGKVFADICFANVRGQMNRFNDKVVKPGMDKAKAGANKFNEEKIKPFKKNMSDAISRIQSNLSREIDELRDIASDKIDYAKTFARSVWFVNVESPKEIEKARSNLSRAISETERNRSGLYAHEERERPVDMRRFNNKSVDDLSYNERDSYNWQKRSLSSKRFYRSGTPEGGSDAIRKFAVDLNSAKIKDRAVRAGLEEELEKLRKKFGL